MNIKNQTSSSFERRALTPDLLHWRKLRVDQSVYWNHHRGGWRKVLELIQNELHSEEGVRFLGAVEERVYSREVICEPWVGFLHEVPHTEYRYPDLERLLNIDTWKANLVRCKGLWVLSDYIREFLVDAKLPVPVNRVYYPVEFPDTLFSFGRFLRNRPRKVVFIGEYLRNYQAFFDLRLPPDYQKILLKPIRFDANLCQHRDDSPVKVIDRLSDDQYDNLLSESIVFLNLQDAPASTTIVECLARTTPILINNVGGVSEYLGESYPLYYENLEEASIKLQDLDLIALSVLYMRRWHVRDKITFDYFLRSFQNTSIYRTLPTPQPQLGEFRSYDLTVIVCSYNRITHLPDLLKRFCAQDFNGDFEVILWNNNIQKASDVQAISNDFMDLLNLKVIHSTHNFYCMARFASISLMKSNLLLICDDDVKPEPGYLSLFIQKYQQYGPDVAICARGHVFLNHVLNNEEPDRVWAKGENLTFYNESDDDCEVHFMHADNCLIPRSILRQVIQMEMNRTEYALVDDYWLSFILSSKLKIPLKKIKADSVLSFTESAEDPEIALSHNPRVNEQRINFYIHHMREEWPCRDMKKNMQRGLTDED